MHFFRKFGCFWIYSKHNDIITVSFDVVRKLIRKTERRVVARVSIEGSSDSSSLHKGFRGSVRWTSTKVRNLKRGQVYLSLRILVLPLLTFIEDIIANPGKQWSAEIVKAGCLQLKPPTVKLLNQIGLRNRIPKFLKAHLSLPLPLLTQPLSTL